MLLSIFVLVKPYIRAFYFGDDGCSWAAVERKVLCNFSDHKRARGLLRNRNEGTEKKCSYLVLVELTMPPVPTWFSVPNPIYISYSFVPYLSSSDKKKSSNISSHIFECTNQDSDREKVQKLLSNNLRNYTPNAFWVKCIGEILNLQETH